MNTTPPSQPDPATDVERSASSEYESPVMEQQQREAPDAYRRRVETRRWWIKLIVQPMLLLVGIVLVIAGLGVAQQMGYLGNAGDAEQASREGAENVSYICPMMCTPPSSKPGRCPVCAMELVPATSTNSEPTNYVDIGQAARRIANIQTIEVKSVPLVRDIRAVGEITYDEGRLKTIAAYVDGRIERLFADYTGVQVAEGDRLAYLYSPRLYSSQVEFLLAKKAKENKSGSSTKLLADSNESLYQSARQRLIEMGLTDEQVSEIEEKGEASSRLDIVAPTKGTVIEKFAVEGQYVSEGEPIYRLADLSTVWLMLELFPEDANFIGYGQKVEAVVHSMPSRTFSGRVAFVDPDVDQKTRTVGIRVVFPNEDGRLKIGDFAKASIEAPVTPDQSGARLTYDPELVGKWISPRHPHVISDSPGTCPLCGMELVKASEYGFVEQPEMLREINVVPRNAVLMAGDHSIVYVETEPGRFELRPVTLGARVGDKVSILEGLVAGEQVATRGNFLLDSQMQFAGNPSLIDPTRLQPSSDFEFTDEMLAAISELSEADQVLAKQQQICPVTKMPLGSMGKPIKIEVDGKEAFLCCAGCESSFRNDSAMYFSVLSDRDTEEKVDPKIEAAMALLSAEDRALAEHQEICPVADFPLGSMGAPVKVMVKGQPVFICCEGCRSSLLETPEKYISKLKSPKTSSATESPAIPPIGEMQILETPSTLPPIGPMKAIEESETLDNEKIDSSGNDLGNDSSKDD